VTVIRVLAETDVGHDDQVWTRALERRDGLLHHTVVSVALEPERVLRVRDPEEEHGLDAERRELDCLAGELVDRELVDARHGRHRPAHVGAGNDEQRLDEVVWLECRLADEIAKRCGASQAARATRPRAETQCLERIRVERRHAESPNCDTSA
jgi:hypothetical protein